MGFGSAAADTTASAQPVPAKPKAEGRRSEPPPRPEGSIPKATAAKPQDTKQAAAKPTLKPSLTDGETTAAPPAKDAVVAGSTPIVQANSFESRFSAAK
jgi:hypothetical protein